MGGLADIEFIVQGLALAGGTEGGGWKSGGKRMEDGCQTSQSPHPGPDVTARDCFIPPASVPGPRSIRRAVQRGFPERVPGSDELSAAFRALRALDHRTRLHTDSSAAKLDEQRFETMVSLGLWPPRFDAGSIETWQDVLRLRREVRAIFRRFCP
jgi:hypothetical protein